MTASSEQSVALTVEEASHLARVSRSKIYLLIKAGELSCRKVGRRSVILRSDLMRWLEALPPSHAAAA